MNEPQQTTDSPDHPNAATLDEPEMLPPPPDAKTIDRVAGKLMEIGQQGERARWDSNDLSTIEMVVAHVLAVPSRRLPGNDDFFWARGTVKPLVRRLADQARWLELARALRLNPMPPKSLASKRDIERSLHAFERMVARSFRVRPGRERPRRIMASYAIYSIVWTPAECEVARSVIFVGERQNQDIHGTIVGTIETIQTALQNTRKAAPDWSNSEVERFANAARACAGSAKGIRPDVKRRFLYNCRDLAGLIIRKKHNRKWRDLKERLRGISQIVDLAFEMESAIEAIEGCFASKGPYELSASDVHRVAQMEEDAIACADQLPASIRQTFETSVRKLKHAICERYDDPNCIALARQLNWQIPTSQDVQQVETAPDGQRASPTCAQAVAHRPLRPRLTLKYLLSLPDGVRVASNCRNGFSELLSSTNRRAVWEKAKALGANGRLCMVNPRFDWNR